MSIGAAAALRTEWVERRKIAEERSDGGEITLLESWAHFKRTLKDHFADTHKEEKAKYEIMYKKQGALTAQEFFVKFKELRRQDGYDIKRNEQFLITLIRNNVNGPLIKQIIYNGNVPTIYVEWKARIVTNNQLWRDQMENEKMMKGSTSGSSERGTSEKKAETVELKKNGTGTLYTGAGKEMEVDKQKFRVEGHCFKCGEKGHRARDHLNGQIPEKKPNKDENDIALFKDTQDLRRKEQSMKEENLKGKQVDKIPKDAAQSVPKGDRTERSAAAKKETTEAQNVMTQLGSITETDAPTRSKEVRNTSDKNLDKKKDLKTPWTAVWIAERLRDQKEERSIGILSSWTHKKRGLEVNADLIKELNTLPIHETVLALEELRKPKQFICGTQGNQMNVTCRLTNLASHQSTTIEALLDSGCAGSCIDNKFVEEQGLLR
ncbi:hypothetical protein SERLADRAFT_442131 [Serpula lacrymans var. lacrymans S7.9]|uniref:CCHC-type domain-containing protein n=1 Tax=Serpula lacrymans var. lacrymans (strain S7.9) TaxID=578457 RepID=F8P8N0_SERL9|nr:uncharacterized protein SERLADRAFT_442131 [Serpula lacrymans var. lacrymans S7.9]EGO20786.1 hypothetical protein SERLADRAFT_442131 [Serpula lacrymans var. lacrymans S7.9]